MGSLCKVNFVTVHPWKRKQKHDGGRGYRVSFSGSSAETIEKEKAFWKCKNPPPEQKSTLAVSGINCRLKRAPQVGEGSLKHCFKTSLGTKQLTSPKRSCITLNCKLAAPPLSRIMGSRRWQSRWWHSFAKRVFDESAEGQSLIN